MQTKLSVFCDRLIEAGWLAAAAVIPLFFNVYSSRVFEPDKLTLLRGIALVMAIAFLIKTIDSLPQTFSLSSWLRKFATATPLTLPVLAFLALYLFTTVTSIAPSVSFWGSYQRLQGTLVNISYITVFFLTAYHLRTKVQLSRLIWVIILDATIISLYAMVQHHRLDPLPWGGDVIIRVTSTMGNAIFLAAYLIMAVPLTLGALIYNLSAVISAPPLLSSPRGNAGQESFPASAKAALALIIGIGAFSFVLKILQIVSIQVNMSQPGATDWLILVVGALLTFGGPTLSIVRPALAPAALAVVFGTSLFGLSLKILQLLSFQRNLFVFGQAEWIVLVLDALLIACCVALLITRPGAFPALRRAPLPFFLASFTSATLLLQMVTIMFTRSRGPWLGIGAGLIVFAYLALLKFKHYRPAIVFTVALVLFGSFVVALNIKDSPLAGLKAKSPYLERIGSLLDTASGTGRVRTLIWFGDEVGKGAVGLITSNPVRAVIGYGPESMYVAYNPFYPPDLAHYEARNASPDRSHNDYLDFLVTMGALGLISYLAVVFGFFYLTARLLWQSTDRYIQIALIGFMAAVGAHLVEILVGIGIAATRTHFWLYLGVGVALFLASRPQKVLSNGVATDGMSPVAASPRGAPAVSARASARRARNRKASNAPQPVAGKSGPGLSGWVLFLPLGIYLVITSIGVIALLLGNLGQILLQDQGNVKVVVSAGFLWLVVGMFLTAVWVGREERPAKLWRSSRWWLYGSLIVTGAYIILAFFLSSIIADILFKRAQAYDNIARYDISTGEYLAAIDWAPTQDFYYLFLGRAYLEMAKRAPDQKSSREVVSMEDIRKLTESRSAVSREDLFNASLVSLRVAKALNPLNTDNSANLGRLHRFWGEMTQDANLRKDKLDKALEFYADALALSPNAAHLYDEWGLVYYVQGKYPEATEKYEKALSLDKRYTPTYLYLGEVYMAQNQMDKAEAMLKEATAIDPSLINAYSTLGYIYHQQGKVQEALEENLKAAKLAPNDLPTHRNLAVIYQELGMFDKAIAEAQVALNLAPADQKKAFQDFIAEMQRRMSGRG